MAVKPIPDGHHSLTPYLFTKGAAGLIDFMTKAFDAKEMHRMNGPDGSVWHAEYKIGDSPVMISEVQAPWQPMPTALYLYVTDCDAVYKRALAAGATSVMEVADQFYGDRNGGVKDQWGNLWWIATHKEDLTSEEISKRAQTAMAQRK